MGSAMQAEDDAEGQLSRLMEEAGLSIAPRLLSALTLIQRSAAFEGDGDLAAAHLVLHDVLQDLEELRTRTETTLGTLESERMLCLRELFGGE